MIGEQAFSQSVLIFSVDTSRRVKNGGGDLLLQNVKTGANQNDEFNGV